MKTSQKAKKKTKKVLTVKAASRWSFNVSPVGVLTSRKCMELFTYCIAVLPLTVMQGEQLEVSPAAPLLSQAVVLGDRRTFAVYDLMQPVTFGTVHSLNLLIRWKYAEGKWEQQSMQDVH